MVDVEDIVRQLFKQQKLCDVVFVVGQGKNTKEIPAHQLYLKTVSDKFLEAFKVDSEHSPQGQLIIRYPDLCPDLFELLIYDAYGIPWDEEKQKKLFKDFDGIMTALDLADRFDIPKLRSQCDDALCKIPTTAENMRFLSIGIKRGLKKLISMVEHHADFYADEVLDVKNVKGVSAEAIQTIFARPHLRVSSTNVLVKYAIAWATEQCREAKQSPTTENMRGFLKQIANYVPIVVVKNSTPEELNVLFSGLADDVKYPLTYRPRKQYSIKLPQTVFTTTGHQLFFTLSDCSIYSIEFPKAIRVQSIVFIRNFNYESPDRIVNLDSQKNTKSVSIYPPYETGENVGIYILHSKYDKSTDELYHVQAIKCHDCKKGTAEHAYSCHFQKYYYRDIPIEQRVKLPKERDMLFEENNETAGKLFSFYDDPEPDTLRLFLASIDATLVFTRPPLCD